MDFPVIKANPASNPEELISLGERKLLQGSLNEALDAFQRAETILGDCDPTLYYREGLALFEYGSEEGQENVLLIASKKFKKGYELDPYSFDLLQAWGNTLALLGERKEEFHFFLDAQDKYEKALGLSRDSQELFWDHAVVMTHIGEHSEEAVDLQKAIRSFEWALEEGTPLPAEFWVDFGAATLLLSTKVRDVRLVVKAVNCFKRAVSEDVNSFDGWSYLAESLHTLYEHTHDEDHFTQANECFETASKLSPQDGDQWLEWAQFLCKAARRTKDVKRLRLCLEKCHRAHTCDSENPVTLAIWAEALALLGEMTDRLDLIYEAENKIGEALDLNEDDPAIWHSFGLCCNSFGSYFNDFDYYYQAIEKFQIGLSIDRACAPLWHAMAKTYATVGTLEDSIEPIEQSLKFFDKALTISSTSTNHIDYATALSKLGEMTHDQLWLEQALSHFEIALSMQKNAVYLHPEWLFSFASTLDMLGDFHDEEKYYIRAIEIFSHVLMVDPDYRHLHHRLAQTFCHLGELLGELDYFYRAIHHLRLNLKQDEDNDHMILDWGIALISIAQHTPVLTDVAPLMQEAEQKMTLSAKLGNIHAYYHLSCLYSILQQYDRCIYFLQKADQFKALPPLEELLHDEWLEGIRSTSAFQEFLAAHPNTKPQN